MSRAKRWVYPRGLIDPPTDLSEPQRPLQLYERGVWDPAEQYWGEPDGLLEICLVEVIAAGPRLQFELEQLLPGARIPMLPTRSSKPSRCATADSRPTPARCSKG